MPSSGQGGPSLVEIEEARREHQKLRRRLYQLRLREAALRELGATCMACGYSADWRALQFDHVNSGANRKEGHGNNPSGSKLQFDRHVARVMKGELQILCANCNWIKRYEREELRWLIKPTPR